MNGFNVNMTKKDIFNAKSGSISIKTAEASEWHTVSGCAVVENGGLDRDKKPCDIGYIATDIGVFGFSSKVCLDHMEELADILSECLNDGEEVKVRLSKVSQPMVSFIQFRYSKYQNRQNVAIKSCHVATD